MKFRDQARQLFIALPLLVLTTVPVNALAAEEIEYRQSSLDQLPSYKTALKRNSFHKRKFHNGFKIKGWRVSESVYFGSAKIAGEYGPGLVVDKGSYVWGFNHQGVEFQLRF